MEDGIKSTAKAKHVSDSNEHCLYRIMVIMSYVILYIPRQGRMQREVNGINTFHSFIIIGKKDTYKMS